MKKHYIQLILLISISISAQAQDWPASTNYIYFGTPTLDQSLAENYALLQKKSDGQTFLNSPSKLQLRINNLTKLIIDNDGKVGIGTTSPKTELDVNGRGRFISQGTDPASGSGVEVFYHNSGYGIISSYDRSDRSYRNLKINANNLYLQSDSGGKVGIGTTSPSALLNIEATSGSTPQLQITSSSDSGRARAGVNNNGGFLGVSSSDGSETALIRSYASGGVQAYFTAGNVGIGTTTPKNKLSVKGTIWAEEVKVSLIEAADWVFEGDYELRSLEEVESFVKTNKHLPDVPSADEFRENDLNLGQMNNILLQKMEEMTLYMIDMNKRVNQLEEENKDLKAQIKK